MCSHERVDRESDGMQGGTTPSKMGMREQGVIRPRGCHHEVQSPGLNDKRWNPRAHPRFLYLWTVNCLVLEDVPDEHLVPRVFNFAVIT